MSQFSHIESIITTKKLIIKEFFSLIKLEFSLAKLSIYPLFFYLIAMFCLIFSIWAIFMACMVELLLPLLGTFLVIFSVLLGINGILLAFFFWQFHKKIQAFGFVKSRQTLKKIL